MKPITHKEVLDMLTTARGFVQKGWMKDRMNNGDEKKLKVCSLGGIEAALARALNKHVLDASIPDSNAVKAGTRTEYRDVPGIGKWGYVKVEITRAEFVAYEAMHRLAATIHGGKRVKHGAADIVANFNDRYDTHKADVLRAFDRTISRTANRRPYAPCKPMKAVSK